MTRHQASFRDPSGYVSYIGGQLHRIILPSYFSEYYRLIQSGLYEQLVERSWLVTHCELRRDQSQIVIQPTPLAFISYPSEWCFDALKSAALLHLRICLLANKYGMILKDASAYNVQFVNNKPIFIDTLSFTHYREGSPWHAFGQLCRHFIAPLLLMKYRSLTLGKTFHNFIDGMPFDLASRMLPWWTWLSPFILLNIHMHSRKTSTCYHNSDIRLKKKSLLNLIDYTALFLEQLTYGKHTSQWSNYHEVMNYTPPSFREKIEVVNCWLQDVSARRIWDVGGNDGYITQQVSSCVELAINTDYDPIAINRSFRNHPRLLSLNVDLTNPTPAYGFANQEREAFIDRVKQAKIDCILVLAVIHHLIMTGCSFAMLANLFAQLTNYLVIEFVDREDSYVAKMLEQTNNNSNFFIYYCRDNFEREFKKTFVVLRAHEVSGSLRTLYLMRKRDSN